MSSRKLRPAPPVPLKLCLSGCYKYMFLDILSTLMKRAVVGDMADEAIVRPADRVARDQLAVVATG